MSDVGQLHVKDFRDGLTLGQYWKGSWDGGFDPGKQHVGLGWKIWNGNMLERNNNGAWQPHEWTVVCEGYGAVQGEGAIFAETMAFQCLVVCLKAVLEKVSIELESCIGVSTNVVAEPDWSNQLKPAVEKVVRYLCTKEKSRDDGRVQIEKKKAALA